MYDRLLNGKNETEGIVSIEPSDSEVTLFIRNPDFTLTTKIIPNKYWILASREYPGFMRLKGDLHFKYGRQFETMSEYQAIKNKLRDKDFYNLYDLKEQTLVNKGLTFYKGLKPSDVSILSFDLETTTIDLNSDAKILLISNTFRDGSGKIEKKLFAYDEFDSTGEMLESWCAWVRKMDPDTILGHNINSFDLNYCKFIAKKEGVKLNLGRDNSEVTTAKYESKFRKDGSQFYHYHKHKIYGREIIDTMFLSIKYDFARKYESYGLKKIIFQEGLEKEGRTFYDASQIRFNYQNPEEWAKIKAYCVDDSDDSLALYDLMAGPFFYMTQSIPKSFQSVIEGASGSQINSIMVRSYIQDGHSVPKASEAQKFEGAISHGLFGIHKNVVSFDVASLYPSIMMEYQIYNKNKDPKGHFKHLVASFTENRLKYKKLYKETGDKYYDDMQASGKIFINSMYGFLGSVGLNFNSPADAALVTQKGREALKTAIQWATGLDYEAWKVKNNIITEVIEDEQF